MSKTVYQRVDLPQVEQAVHETRQAVEATDASLTGIRWATIGVSLFLCIAQSIVTILASNIRNAIINPTLIPGFAFGVFFLLVMLFNPLLRGTSMLMGPLGFLFRPLNRRELMCIFAAMMVTSGVATFGLTEQLIPLITTPFNPEWNTPQRGWDQMTPNMNPSLYIQDRDVIETFRQGVRKDVAGNDIKVPKDDASLSEKSAHWSVVAQAIPWSAWIKPLGYWLILIGATYSLFYCLTYVVLEYWANREKLIFPLARLPESLLPDESRPNAWFPALVLGPLFWIGFSISFCIHSWNALATSGLITAISPISLGMGRHAVDSLIAGGIWQGLGGDPTFGLMFLIIFTAIGLAFLLPVEISLSVWMYFVIGKIMLLIVIWMGYGKTGADFPSDWLWYNNLISAQGGGGILLFSALGLFRCIRDYRYLVTGKSMAERVKVGLPVVGMFLSIIVLTAWFSWNNLSPIWALVFVLVLTILTIGLMRIVAEAGMYWFQSHTSFFHYYKFLGLGKFHALSPALVGPLLPIYSVLFLDIKTFMAPSMLNAAEMHRTVGGGRAKFHINIILCLVVSVIVSLGFALFLAHLRGAQQMQSWFYSSGPPWVIDLGVNATRTPPAFNPGIATWYGVGMVWTGVSMYLRQSLFWFPHPIGYIMLINPLMPQLWFSFFIGWVFKKITVAYGGKNTFDVVRAGFIGLILGELMAIFFWTAMSLLYGINIGVVTLNRYT